jgi:hypothetical protein
LEIPDPTTQGQQSAAETPGSDGQVVAPEVPAGESPNHEGFQKRINELTRARHEAERRAEAIASEKDAQINQLIASIAAGQRPAAPEQVPQFDFDPEEKKKFDAYHALKVDPVLKELREQNALLRSQVGQNQFSQFAAGEDPRVVQRAQWLLKNSNYGKLVQQGVATPEDVLTFARGEVAKTDAQKNAQSRNALGQFNASAETTLTGQSSAAPKPPASNDLPKDFETLSPNRQAEILEKRLDGVKL